MGSALRELREVGLGSVSDVLQPEVCMLERATVRRGLMATGVDLEHTGALGRGGRCNGSVRPSGRMGCICGWWVGVKEGPGKAGDCQPHTCPMGCHGEETQECEF